MTDELKPCIHAEVCAEGCDLEDITECGYYRAERTCRPLQLTAEGAKTEHIVVFHIHGCTYQQVWPYQRCSECNANFPEGSNYCPNCGGEVVKQ